MSEANGKLDGLMDFSFRKHATPKMLKVLYSVHLFGGLIAAVAFVVLAFQKEPVQGLLALLGGTAGYALWILYCRVALEVLAAVFRIAEAVSPSPQQQEYGESRYPEREMVGSH